MCYHSIDWTTRDYQSEDEMQIEFVPLLRVQRDLYAIPLGWERFRAYIATMTGDGDDIVLPLVSMNPMGKEHIPALIDTLLGFDAEAVAAAAIEEARQRLADAPGALRVGLVVTDDARGGWTNRYFTEMSLRFDCGRLLDRDWSIVPIWTSEEWSPAKLREEVLAVIYRAAYFRAHGQPKTLRRMIEQEGMVAAFSGTGAPTLDADDLDYTREVLQTNLDATDYPTLVACLYGDEAARAVGYPPLGLSERAGYALARDEALRSGAAPAAALTVR